MFPKPQYPFLDDTGSTTESAILMIVMAFFAGILYMVIQGGDVKAALSDLIQRALSFSG